MTEMHFSTPYMTKYTEDGNKEKHKQFVSKYEVKKANTVISVETRSRKKRFKSRQVQK